MNYVILAAGIGSRLYPYTKNFAKCLVNLDKNECIIERCIRFIRKYDESANIIVVTGFQHDKVEEKSKGCIHIHNPFYKITNSIASLWFAKEEILKNEMDLVIINSDIVFDESLTKEICERPQYSTIFYDSSIKVNGDYNIQIYDNKVIVMGKELNEYDGEYAGITKLALKDLKLVFDEINNLVENELYDQWYENALVQLMLRQIIIFSGKDISEHQWSEIDSINNLLRIRNIVHDKK
jgi:choline kinase